MQQKASTEPIGFNLLPKLFTLSQLQSLYEAIYGEQIDKRNFRKRIAEMDYIEKQIRLIKQVPNAELPYTNSMKRHTARHRILNYKLCWKN